MERGKKVRFRFTVRQFNKIFYFDKVVIMKVLVFLGCGIATRPGVYYQTMTDYCL